MRKPTVVHLPVYPENPYQPMLMEAQRDIGWKVIDGGGGGNFTRTALRNWKADVLHFHWLHPYLLRESAIGSIFRGLRFQVETRLIRQSGASIVWTIHNLENHSQQFPTIEKRLTQCFVNACDAIVTHGSIATHQAVQLFSIRDTIPVLEIPHPSYASAFPSSISKDQAKEILNLRNDAFVFLCIGRLEKYKNIDQLISAFRSVDRSNARLIIAGRASDPHYVTYLESLVGDDRRIMLENKYVTESEISNYMSACDIVVCPSRGILTSGSVALGMSFGRPSIAPNEGCAPEALAASGILYDPSEAGGLEGALLESINRIAELPKMGQLASRIMAEASPHGIAVKLDRLYREVISARGFCIQGKLIQERSIPDA